MFRVIAGLWRWRGNPLCRRSDRVEGWVALASLAFVVLGVPAVGWLCGCLVHQKLLDQVEEERQHRHRVWATVDRIVPQRPAAPDPDAVTERDGVIRVSAVWSGVDGSTRTGLIDTDRALEPGERFRIWVDRHNRVASQPLTTEVASSQALLAGLAAGGATAALVETGRRVAVRHLLRLRYTRIDREWSRFGRDPGRDSGRGTERGPV